MIQRDGELSEFASVLRDLAVPVDVHDARSMPHPDTLAGASVVVVPGRRLIETNTPNLSLWPRTIAVVDGSSRTLISHLNRLGVALIIRRPIHGRTLRLLLLHEVYRGPERRNRKRTLIGHPIKAGSGLFKQNATLLELSPSGARIEVAGLPKVGSKLRLLIGKELTLGKPLKLDVKVIRCLRPSGASRRKGAEIGVAMLDPRRDAQTVNALLSRFAKGPAPWSGKQTPRPGSTVAPVEKSVEAVPEATPSPAAPAAPAPTPTPAVDPESSARRLPPSHALRPEAAPVETPNIFVRPIDDPGDSMRAERQGEELGERRSDPRVPYDQRVVALDEEAARVIVGRELSHGGMRVESSGAIQIGDTLRVALHCGTGHQPLIVLAEAIREDEDDTTVLSFVGLSESQREAMDRIIATSRPIETDLERDDHGDVGASAIVIGEMLGKVDSEAGGRSSVCDTGEAVEDSR